MRGNRWGNVYWGVAIGLVFAVCLVGFLFFEGVLQFNYPSRQEYPVRGIDVSAYQGDIDWQVLSKQEIDFAFIKATEGSTFIDKCFVDNWRNASDTPLLTGAYHFFSYDSAGDTQAENFIATVPKQDGALPPVVDVEFYGDKEKNLPPKEYVQKELHALLKRFEEYYGVKPVLYATEKSYALYIAGDFADYPIWIRGIFYAPNLPDGRVWQFWQYTNRARLDGYKGTERFIDMNVFSGTVEQLQAMVQTGD